MLGEMHERQLHNHCSTFLGPASSFWYLGSTSKSSESHQFKPSLIILRTVYGSVTVDLSPPAQASLSIYLVNHIKLTDSPFPLWFLRRKLVALIVACSYPASSG